MRISTSAVTTVAKIFQRSALSASAATPASTPTLPATQTRLSSSQVATLPSEKLGATSATVTAAINGQYQRVRAGQRSSSAGRHSAASATRIGYSAIHEKMKGAISPAK